MISSRQRGLEGDGVAPPVKEKKIKLIDRVHFLSDIQLRHLCTENILNFALVIYEIQFTLTCKTVADYSCLHL